MKKFHKTLVSTLLLSTSLFANEAEINSQIEQVTMLKDLGAKVTQVVTHPGLYHFKAKITGKRAGVLEGFITKDLQYLFIGDAYDASSGSQLVIPYILDPKALKEVAAFKMGNGKNEYFLFTDPECPYCHKLDRYLTDVKDDVTLYAVLFPLSFHKNAKNMSRYILSQKNDAAKIRAMHDIANKKTTYKNVKYSAKELEAFNAQIEKSLALVNDIGIRGTPTILNAQGIQVSPVEIKK